MTPSMRRIAGVMAAMFAFALAACGGGNTGSNGSGNASPAAVAEGSTLHCIAGSELSDLGPQLSDLQRATGVAVQLEYSGTLAGIARINSGEAFDCAWFSHAKYLVESDKAHRIRAQDRIMLSPVVLGVKESVARRLHWENNPNVTWKDIANAAASGRLRYAMTNPTSSNSGFTATIGVVSALVGASDALRPSQVETARLNGFFKGQTLTAGSSGWLIDAYVRDQDRLDGMVNYEANLLSLNASKRLTERLVLIYPKEGIITADYPFILLNESKRPLYDKAVAFLKSADTQRAIMNATYRRPVNPAVALSSAFPKALIVELPFPGNVATIDSILSRYLNDNRVPPHSFYVLDVSGSMRGPRLEAVRKAIDGLAGADPSQGGQFARFANREHITMISFSDGINPPAEFQMHGQNDTATLQRITGYADSLEAGGNTAIFGAIERAEDLAYAAMQHDAPHYYSIVLMTDGENNQHPMLDEFERRYRTLPAQEKGVRVFPIIFGEASPEELKQLAELTGGRLFDGRKESLSDIFREIRGYQ